MNWRNYLIILVIFSLSSQIYSQDRHYWFQQFGGRSTLLGGSMIADAYDNSATFYNPGALGFVQNNMLSISANAYSVGYFKLDNALGDGQELHGFPFLLYPQLISGFVPFAKNDKWKWAYSLISRNSSSFLMFDRYQDNRDVLKNVQGDEVYIAGFEVQSAKQEQWGGISVAHKINDNFSFGSTMYISYKSVNGYETLFYNAFPQTDNPIDTSGNNLPFYVSKLKESRYYYIPIVSLIWKFGLAYQNNGYKVGFSATMPSINLDFMKYGDSQREISGSNLQIEDVFLTDFLFIGRQEDRQTRMNTPLSFALGFSRVFDKGSIHLTGEYFFPVATHEILEADKNTEIISTPSNDLNFVQVPNMSVVEAYRSVFNLAIGFEYRILPKIDLLTGLRTDFNNYDNLDYTGDNPPEDIYSSPWDLYHLTIGGTYIGKKSNLTMGLQYSLGFGETDQYQNFTDVSNSSIGGLQNPNLNKMNYSYNGLLVTISYTYLFDTDND
jgi:hypothetical protein